MFRSFHHSGSLREPAELAAVQAAERNGEFLVDIAAERCDLAKRRWWSDGRRPWSQLGLFRISAPWSH